MIWLEILSRHHEVISRQRIEVAAGQPIRIGRAYDCDVVLDDPFVAPHHLSFQLNEAGQWTALDANTANGALVEHTTVEHIPAQKSARGTIRMTPGIATVVGDDDIIHIGKTLVRVRSAHSPVAAERILPATLRHTWRWPLLMAGLLIGLAILGQWLGETAEPKASRYFTGAFGVAVILLGWTTAWALLSRLFSGYAQFERHLLVALGGALISAVAESAIDFASFSFSATWLADYQFIVQWIIVAATIFFHLRIVGPKRLILKSISVVAAAGLGIALMMVSKSEAKLAGQANYLRQLKPPMIRLASEQTEADFFANAEKLKAKLDTARKEEKLDGGASGFDIDE